MSYLVQFLGSGHGCPTVATYFGPGFSTYPLITGMRTRTSNNVIDTDTDPAVSLNMVLTRRATKLHWAIGATHRLNLFNNKVSIVLLLAATALLVLSGKRRVVVGGCVEGVGMGHLDQAHFTHRSVWRSGSAQKLLIPLNNV